MIIKDKGSEIKKEHPGVQKRTAGLLTLSIFMSVSCILTGGTPAYGDEITSPQSMKIRSLANPRATENARPKKNVAMSSGLETEGDRVQADRIKPLYATDGRGQNKGIISRITSLPKSAAGVTCGVLVGVPIMIARDTKKYSKQMRSSIGGADTDITDAMDRASAAGMALPFGVMSGIIHGSIKGVQQGMDVGWKRPFTKESMSLEE